MKEPFEDRMTYRIKEVLTQYEPEYSPQAWEDFQTYVQIRKTWFERLLPGYYYWFDVFLMIIILSVIFTLPVETLLVNNAEADILRDSEAVKNNESVSVEEETINKPPVYTVNDGYEPDVHTRKEKNIFINFSSGMVDSVPVNYSRGIEDNNETMRAIDNVTARQPYQNSLNQSGNSQLVPVQINKEEIPDLIPWSYSSQKNQKLHWPDLNLREMDSKRYNKFTGPDRFTVFYSPEFHYSESTKNLGISQGLGVGIEGLILRSFISASGGFEFQTLIYNRTTFNGKVKIPNQPVDTIYRDSLSIIRGNYRYIEIPLSINYKFLERGRSQIWIGTGISSIAFLQQQYSYETRGNFTGLSQDSSSVKAWKNIHPAASWNSKLQYRYKLSGHIYLNSTIQYKLHLGALGANSLKINRLNFQIGFAYLYGRNY